MHTRRAAAFLLGAWIGCSILLGWIALDNRSSRERTAIASGLQATTSDGVNRLLDFQASLQTSRYLNVWDAWQIVLWLVLTVCLIFALEKRLASMILSGLMILLVLFEHFFVRAHAVGSLDSVYFGAEGAKLVLGGILASYLFVLRPDPKGRKKKGSAGSRTTPSPGREELLQ